ncbi:MAG TPA: HAMP domain-containing sensor histidine kinase [Vicinamibacterales bacterium]|nr:HAMP domain-containing sensor histidine kinase [Vicinamibacterales bacterium]
MELLRDRSVRLAAGLTVAVAIPVAVLFYFQFRSISALSQSSGVVLRQLSQESADGVTQGLQDALKAPYINVLLRVPQSQTEPLDLSQIGQTLQQGLSSEPFVDRFYVWSDLTDEHKNEVLAFDRQHNDFTDEVPEAALLVQKFRELAEQKHAISIFEATVDGHRTYFQAQLRFRFPARDKLTSFVALRVDAERLRREFIPAFIVRRMRTVEGPTGFPALTVTVLDQNGTVLFPPGVTAATPYVDERTLPMVFFDPELRPLIAPEDHKPEMWRLRSGYGGQTIAQIVAGRARPQRAMMAILAGIMALGVFYVVRAAAHEVRVAEMKSTFVSSVSHDLKTPLALIQLFAETLELGRMKSTDRAQEYYRIINSEARKLTRLINNLLDFSKIEAGLRRYKRQPVDLSAMTRRVLESLDSQFRHNQFSIVVKLDGPVPVLIDEEAAQQALENLLSNAMKYSPENREIAVEVKAADGYGTVSVVDRGIGIPGRLQRRIFRKFYRVQTDAGTGPQGTGLGLAIVDHVMRGHRGFVRVESEPGKGSTFTLHFPLFAGEFHGDETDTGDRGRAPDVARSA